MKPLETSDLKAAETALAHHERANTPVKSISNLPPTSRQIRSALSIAVVLVVSYGASVPFANVPLPPSRGILSAVLTLIFATNLITAVLIFSQSSINGSRALLVLASGYLFSSLIMIPYVLTFTGTLGPEAVIGSSIQTSPFLFNIWHFGFLTAVTCYALTRHLPPTAARPPIGWSVILVVGLICVLVWIIIAHGDLLPNFIADDAKLAPSGHYIPGVALFLGVLALTAVWSHRVSVLDLWLSLVVLSIVLELSLVTFFIVDRNALGAYFIRAYLAVAGTLVLSVLLSENAKLYATIARSNVMLQRERQNKMMNLEAMAASISHEVRQPLAAIVSNGSAALRFLDHAPPNLEEVRSALTRLLRDSHRVEQVFDSLRALFGKRDQGMEPINANEIVLEALRIFRDELRNHRIVARTHLTSELLPIMGNRGQLLEVIINLIHNAIEAMDGVKADRRVLQVKTQLDGDSVLLTVEDSGPGIDPNKMTSIFDAFVTTKQHGMGLGLAICRTIVERHAGKMFVVPADPHGCVFKVVLPIGTPDLQKAEHELEQSPGE